MAAGRCAGCGDTGPERSVIVHTQTCAKFAELVRTEPSRALDPVAEHERWQVEDKPAERERRLRDKVADTDARRAVQAGRFATRNLLED